MSLLEGMRGATINKRWKTNNKKLKLLLKKNYLARAMAGQDLRVALLTSCEGSYVITDVHQATEYVLTIESQYAKLVNMSLQCLICLAYVMTRTAFFWSIIIVSQPAKCLYSSNQ